MRPWLLSAVFAATLVFSGCAGGYTYARVAPPPARVEVRSVAPGPGYVWIDGYWGYPGGRYTWVPGYWARPPRSRAQWAAPRWESRGGRYYYHKGHWR